MILVPVLFLIFTKSQALNTAPVLIMDYENSMTRIKFEPNPFKMISADDFSAILQTAQRISYGVLLFVEEKIRIEDITSKDSLGTPYRNFHEGLMKRKVKYLPKVHNPLETIKSVFPVNSRNQLTAGLGVPLELSDQRYFYVNFVDDSNDTRVTKLRKHDVLMQQIYFMFRQTKSGPIIAFYTGASNPLREQKLQLMAPKYPRYTRYSAPYHPLTNFKVKTEKVIIMLGGITNSRRRAFGVPVVSKEVGDKDIKTNLNFVNFELQFNILRLNGSWKLVFAVVATYKLSPATVSLYEGGEVVGSQEMPSAGAPSNWSYFCAQPLSLKSNRDGMMYTVSRYQLEPVEEEREPQNDTFSEPYNCAKYVTAPLVVCLFVTFVLLFCLFYALVWVANVCTNDRFDDPLGKIVTFGERL